MKAAPPLSPYGVFSGQLFQYSVNPSLIAFDSFPSTTSPLLATAFSCSNKCILLGGLSDGPIPTPYTKLLETKCHSLGWSLVQPVLSSSYLGFGHGSLSRDTDEIMSLMEYLICHHSADRFAFVGHSTGCQNSMHLLKYGRKDLVERVKVVALQAPVSDRESLTLNPGDSSINLSHAKSLQQQGKGDEMMPRSAFWAPITASRYLSLFDVDGDDDFFSSDLSDDDLHDRLGHAQNLGRKSGLRILVAFSKKDEYVPERVDKDGLLKRLVKAMNSSDCDEDGNVDEPAVASGVMLENANHNLSNDERDKEMFVELFGKLLAESDCQTTRRL